jgi:hypothetical protein
MTTIVNNISNLDDQDENTTLDNSFRSDPEVLKETVKNPINLSLKNDCK